MKHLVAELAEIVDRNTHTHTPKQQVSRNLIQTKWQRESPVIALICSAVKSTAHLKNVDMELAYALLTVHVTWKT